LKRLILAGGVLSALLTWPFVQGQERRPGGSPAVYRTEVPVSELNVIAGAPTSSSVILSILSRTSGSAEVSLTLPGGSVRTEKVKLEAEVPCPLLIEKLPPGTSVPYVLRQGDQKVEGRFSTARKVGERFVFAIQADSHLDGNSDERVYERTLANVRADRPDFLVDLGDTFMVDKYPDPKDALKQYRAQRYWFSRIGSELSVFLCLGNHDGEVGWPARDGESSAIWAREQREKFFPTIRENGFYSGAPTKGLYYAWVWGDAQFIVLDPFVATTRKARTDEDGWNWTLGETQFKWFEEILKQSTSRFKFVFIHHLVGGFGKEARGGVEASDRFEWGDHERFGQHRIGWAAPIHALMKRHEVTALFHGHDHLYVRQERDGIVYLEVPQPSHRRGDQTSSAEEYGYKSGKILGSSGHIRVTVDPAKVTLEYVRSESGDGNRRIADSVDIPALAR